MKVLEKLVFIMVVALLACSETDAQTIDSIYISDDIFAKINTADSGGSMQIYQDPALHVLMDKTNRINKKDGLEGYRIQIFSGSGQDARDHSYKIQTEFLQQFPDFDPDLIYNIYQAPFFKLRLGDFRSKNEAVEFFHLVKQKFPNSYIVKSKIKYPKLESDK